MKISRSNRAREQSIKKGKPKSSVSIKHSSFFEVLEEQDKPKIEIDIELEKIEEYARQLREQPNFYNLRTYKIAVKTFLLSVIEQMYNVEEKSSIDRYGRRRVYMLIEKMDGKLEELTRLFLNHQAPTFNLTKQLDEIRGLLLDIVS